MQRRYTRGLCTVKCMVRRQCGQRRGKQTDLNFGERGEARHGGSRYLLSQQDFVQLISLSTSCELLYMSLFLWHESVWTVDVLQVTVFCGRIIQQIKHSCILFEACTMSVASRYVPPIQWSIARDSDSRS